MRRLCLILIAAVFLGGCSVAQAREPVQAPDSVLSDYLHSRQLPLVEARLIDHGHGDRSVLLYGYVATEFGKEDAENKVRDFMDDPDIAVTNRIKVSPELLTLGREGRSETAAQNSQVEPEDNTQQAANQDNLPADIQGREAYENQERDDALLQANGVGVPLSLPLIMAIMNSGVIAGPMTPQVFGPPTFFNQMPPIVSVPPVVIIRTGPPTAFGPFPPVMRPSYYPFPFPAGPAPMFPATGGTPFPSAAPGFGGGFAPHGFPSTFPSGGFPAGGFTGGFGFGGHR